MFTVISVAGGVPLRCWTDGVPFEDGAREQLEAVARLPFMAGPIVVMPDVHKGIGSTIGSVIATTGAIIPAAVGVDIGCGVMARHLGITASQLPSDLAGLRKAIEAAVPHGRSDDGGDGDVGAWKTLPEVHQGDWAALKPIYDMMCLKYPRLGRGASARQLGTLGTGNHFIELCVDEREDVWATIHSGSRGPGNRIGADFTSMARAAMKLWHITLTNADLAYLPEGTELFKDYVMGMKWAMTFASASRFLMMIEVVKVLRGCGLEIETPLVDGIFEMIDCVHNYMEREHHHGKDVFVTRKGAVRARAGDRGVIPGSMGTPTYIVKGKGNPDSLASCSHGAGRRMSRTEARRTFTTEDHRKATEGVECPKGAGVLDETPGAYKDIGAVMAAQSDLIEIEHVLFPILNVKGCDEPEEE
jgi:tRNA-splicing ligase RtcB